VQIPKLQSAEREGILLPAILSQIGWDDAKVEECFISSIIKILPFSSAKGRVEECFISSIIKILPFSSAKGRKKTNSPNFLENHMLDQIKRKESRSSQSVFFLRK
jgi:hypothetical protein